MLGDGVIPIVVILCTLIVPLSIFILLILLVVLVSPVAFIALVVILLQGDPRQVTNRLEIPRRSPTQLATIYGIDVSAHQVTSMPQGQSGLLIAEEDDDVEDVWEGMAEDTSVDSVMRTHGSNLVSTPRDLKEGCNW